MNEDNEILREIRATREKLMREFNHDLNALLKYLQEEEKNEEAAGRKLVSPPGEPDPGAANEEPAPPESPRLNEEPEKPE